MIKLLFLALVLIIGSGCANKRGISAKYYNGCREYYDLQGTYHKVCEDNILEYEELKKPFESTEPEEKRPYSNVW